MKKLPICKYPTTVMLVDDSPYFLASAKMLIPRDSFRPITFSSPTEALKRLQSTGEETDFLHTGLHNVEDDSGQIQYSFNVSTIFEEIYNPHRFDAISTVIVDYEMPEMNGLEFCKKITNPYVRKILLTGVADENIAMEALNAGLISGYLKKQDKDWGLKLPKILEESANIYFNRLSSSLERLYARAARRDWDYPLEDPEFVATFESTCKTLNITEYYLCSNTGNYLLMDASGKSYGLFVKSEKRLQEEVEGLKDSDLPESILSRLVSKKEMICFQDSEGAFLPDSSDLNELIYPVTNLIGDRKYYMSLGPNRIKVNQEKIARF